MPERTSLSREAGEGASHSEGGGSHPTTRDAFLSGAIMLTQPKTGYRATSDSVLLAALAPVKAHRRVLELGLGYGQVSLCLLAREPDLEVTGIELLPDVAALAIQNARDNHFSEKLTVICGNVADTFLVQQLHNRYDFVITNPPYRQTHTHTASKNPVKAAATTEQPDAPLVLWVRAAAHALVDGGTLLMIHDAARKTDILAALGQHPFGNVFILPLAAKEGDEPRRLVVKATKSGKNPSDSGVVTLPPLVLHHAGGAWRDEINTVLRGPFPLDPWPQS